MFSFRLLKNHCFPRTKFVGNVHTTAIKLQTFLRLAMSIRNFVTLLCRPYVELPWAYAFGRSNEPLRNLTVGDLLQARAEKDGNKKAVVSHHENIVRTFSELNDEANHLASGLYNKLGVRRGDVVGIWSCNSYNWLVAEYAAFKLGAIVCTINPVYKMSELEFVLKNGDVKCLFMPGVKSKQEQANNYYDLITKSDYVNSTNNNVLQHIIHMDGQSLNRKLGNVFTHEMSSIFDNQPISKEVTAAVDTDDPVLIMYTSGTTGKPKGAVLSHHTIVNNAMLATTRIINRGIDNSICLPLPLFHAFANVLGSVTMPCIPATVVLPGYWFQVKSVVESILENKCNLLMLTPTMIIDIMSYIDKHNIKLDSVTSVLLGGAAVPVDVACKIQESIPSASDIRIGYGATELGPATTASVASDELKMKVETVGGPLDYVEIKVVDPVNNKLVKIGEQGELWVRGHNVMIGYWRNEEKTKEVITDNGWYKTGDIVTMDETGYVKVVGRTKEMIIRGGENVYPREVEELLHLHPDIEMAAVCGVPDDRYGEELCAWIKLNDPKKVLHSDDIKQFCKDKITYFKIPKYVLFVDDFPMTNTFKVKKFEMTAKSCEILGIKKR